MRVVIPVAGAGTRLRPHTYSLPKPLLHVAGRPVIDHLLDPILKLDPEEVIFVVGLRGDRIEEYVRKRYTFKSKFIHQEMLLGLGYAINVAIKEIHGGELLVLLGDTIVECDLAAFIKAGDNVLGLRQVEDPQRFGIAVIENNRVVNLEEKPENPKTNLAVIGLYYFKEISLLRRMLTDHVSSGRTTCGEIQFTDALQRMIEGGATFVPYEVNRWFDCGKKETMLSTNRYLVAAMKQMPAPEGCAVIPPVFVHPGAEITASVIGPNVSISEGSVCRNCIIRNSIIGCNSTIEDMVLLDSLVGHDVVLKGNAQILNVGDSSEITNV